ncbi:hypothetical protein M3Y99_00687000 [Aphelenchoides fujianensis]|nr:hypothetical protein M3Y99_00687000 [Aphelenchoides fujianensis]
MKVVAEGNKKDLKTTVWIRDAHGEDYGVTNAGIDGEYELFHVMPGEQICCRVWTDACWICRQVQQAAADARIQFEGERSQLEAQISGLKTDRLTLEAEIEALKLKLAEQVADSSVLRSQVDELNAKLRESSQAATNLQSELAAVRQENEGYKAEKKQLDTKISELTAAMEKSPETVDELAAVQEKLESAENEKGAFKQKAEESAAKIAELTAALEQHQKMGEGWAKDAALSSSGWVAVDAK